VVTVRDLVRLEKKFGLYEVVKVDLHEPPNCKTEWATKYQIIWVRDWVNVRVRVGLGLAIRF